MHSTTPGSNSAGFKGPARRLWPSLPRLSLGLVVLGLLAGPVPAAQTSPPKGKTINELKAFFQANCIRCHGLDGSAKSPAGKVLGGRDFTQSAKHFRELSGPASEREIRAYIRTIQRGILFGYTMPSWKEQLSPEDSTLMVRDILLQAEVGKVIEPEADKPL